MSELAETKPICAICEEPHWPYEHHVWLPLAVHEARAAAKAQAEAEERRRAAIVTKPADDRPGVAEFPESYARALEIDETGRGGRPRIYATNAERQRAYRMRKAGTTKCEVLR